METLPSAAQRTLNTPELLEQILLYLPCQLLPLNDQEDPRSVRVRRNAEILNHLLRCAEVNQRFHACIHGSKRLLRALFLLQDDKTGRSWDHSSSHIHRYQHGPRAFSYYIAPSLKAPQLNPLIQITFEKYHFRFWHLSLEMTNSRHCAYLIITRKNLPAVDLRARTGQGRNVSNMLLSQPPAMALEATIWEERDESKEYVGRTTALRDPMIRCDDSDGNAVGLTIGMVHERVSRMFELHRDVSAIKLTTV